MIHKIETLNIDRFQNNTQIKVYPNPSSETFTIVCSQSMETIQLYNLQGQLLKQMDAVNTNETKIDISQFKTGVYLLKITTRSKKSISKRIILK